MKKTLTILAALVALSLPQTLGAQTKSFKLGQWVEIENSILKNLNAYYVDSLQVDRIMQAGIDAMLDELDPYTIYVPEAENEDFEMMLNKTYGGIGAIIHKKVGENVVINEPYYGSPAWKNGLVCGDEIIAIDGENVKDFEAKQASDRMKGKPGTSVNFTVKKLRSGEIVEVPIVREKIHLPDVEYAGMVDDTTGYILQTGFTSGVAGDIRNSYFKLKEQGMKRLVLDLRGNSGGLLSEAVDIVSLFIPKGSVVVRAKGRDNIEERVYKTSTDPIDTEIPLIVMIDASSASSSEIVAGAIQDLDRGTIMGRRSYGKGLVQSVLPVAYNGQLKLTSAKYYTPSGRCVQAIDYSHRNEDGSVGHILDSLTHEFKTAKGRSVRDGGGITPDYDIPAKSYSRIVYSLVLSGIVENYTIEYVRKHESIPPVGEFHFGEEDYEDFIAFAKTQEFDYRSSAKALFDQMEKELGEDGLKESVSSELEALRKAIDMDKEKILRLKKAEIVPFIEEEIAIRYYYQEAGIQIRLRYDTQLLEALTKPML